MSRFEDDLRTALRRKEPPPGFAERALARAAVERETLLERLLGLFRFPAVRWVCAAALLLMLLLGVRYQQARRARQEGEEARAKVLYALQVTGSKLQLVQQKLRQLEAERETQDSAEEDPATSGRKIL